MPSDIIPTHTRLVQLLHALDRQSRLGYGTLVFGDACLNRWGQGNLHRPAWHSRSWNKGQGPGAFGFLGIWCNTARHGAIYMGAQVAYHGYLGWLRVHGDNFGFGNQGHSWLLNGAYIPISFQWACQLASAWLSTILAFLCTTLEGHNTIAVWDDFVYFTTTLSPDPGHVPKLSRLGLELSALQSPDTTSLLERVCLGT